MAGVASFGLMLSLFLVWMSAPIASTRADDFNDGRIRSYDSLPQECILNEECPDSHFCFGRGNKKRCTPCYDCTKIKRNPRKTYDGISCAADRTQCGSCVDGYEATDGEYSHCQPIPTITFSTPRFGTSASNGTDRSVPDYGSTIWLLLLVIFSACLLVWVVPERLGWRRRGSVLNDVIKKWRGGEAERIELSGPPQYSPSAPPYEPREWESTFHSRPYVQVRGTDEVDGRACTENGELQQANPFNRGNGPSDYIVQDPDPAESDDEMIDEENDEVQDQLPANNLEQPDEQPPAQQQQQSQAVAPSSTNARFRSASQPGGVAVPGPSSTPSSNSAQEQSQPNPVMGSVIVGLSFSVSFPPPFLNQPSSSSVQSAPTSPRRSLDSGNGTDDGSRWVPDNSDNDPDGGFSDMDHEVSLYDD